MNEEGREVTKNAGVRTLFFVEGKSLLRGVILHFSCISLHCQERAGGGPPGLPAAACGKPACDTSCNHPPPGREPGPCGADAGGMGLLVG